MASTEWSRVIFAIAMAMLLAGCVAQAPPDGQATAMEVRGTALQEVKKWKPDARINTVFGVESKNATPGGEGLNGIVAMMVGDGDPVVGDGRTEAWLFACVSPSQDSESPVEYLVVVAADRSILLSRLANEDEHIAIPFEWVVEWRVDTDEAARNVARLSSRWDDAESPVSVSYMLLYVPKNEEPGAALEWSMSVGYGESSESEFFQVDATSGTARTEAPPPPGGD